MELSWELSNSLNASHSLTEKKAKNNSDFEFFFSLSFFSFHKPFSHSVPPHVLPSIPVFPVSLYLPCCCVWWWWHAGIAQCCGMSVFCSQCWRVPFLLWFTFEWCFSHSFRPSMFCLQSVSWLKQSTCDRAVCFPSFPSISFSFHSIPFKLTTKDWLWFHLVVSPLSPVW